MYIEKYWGNFIGGSDDSLNLVAFLEDRKKEEITISEIFNKIGLNKQNWDFKRTVEPLKFNHSLGFEMDFNFAIDIIIDLAAIILECNINGNVNLHDLSDNEDTPSQCIKVIATAEEYERIDKCLLDFTNNPMSYDLYEMIGDGILEMAEDVEELRKELYKVIFG